MRHLLSSLGFDYPETTIAAGTLYPQTTTRRLVSPGPMDAKHDVGQTQNGKFIIGGNYPFDFIINIHVAAFLVHAFVSAILAQPDPLKATLDSSPFLALALSFSCAKTVYPKFRAQKELTLPPFRLVESAMKRRQLVITPQVKERALTALILTVLSLFFAHVAIELPDKCWNMKVWFTMYWINLDIQFFMSEMYRSTTDTKLKRRIAAARGVCLAIVLAHLCYCFVMPFLLYKWTGPCLVFILGFSYLCYVVKLIPSDPISSSYVPTSFWDALLNKPISPDDADFIFSMWYL